MLITSLIFRINTSGSVYLKCHYPAAFMASTMTSEMVNTDKVSELYDANRNWMRDDELLVVSGKAELDAYSGSMRVTADELYDFASARAAFAKRLDIHCSIDGTVRVPKLVELLSPYRGGKCPIQLYYRNLIGSAPLRLGDDWQVTLPDELLDALREQCGKDNVQVIYA